MATGPHSRTLTSRARSTLRAAAARLRTGRGQSLAEFSLTVPMALLMILFGLDFGRVFLGWVALNNAAREAANYAAMNPAAWTVPYNLDVQDEFDRLVQTEASNINCVLESPVSDPDFPDGTSIGAPARVELSCGFNLITPFIGMLIGDPIPVSASSAFPVRAGLVESVPTPRPTATPTPTPSPTDDDDASPTPSVTATPSATPSPSPTPATCTVISLLNVNSSQAQLEWSDAGFTGTVIFSPLVPPNYRIAWQSLTVGTTVSCATGITVRSRAP